MALSSRAPNRKRRDFQRHQGPRSRDAKQHPCSQAPSCNSDITRSQRSSPKLLCTHKTSPLYALDTQCFRNASFEPRRPFDRLQLPALPAVRTPRAASKAPERALFGVLRTMLSTEKGRPSRPMLLNHPVCNTASIERAQQRQIDSPMASLSPPVLCTQYPALSLTIRFAVSRFLRSHGQAADLNRVDLWRKLSIYVVIPAVILSSLNAKNLWDAHWEHWSHLPPLEERPEYPYQNIRSKNYFWGDGDKVRKRSMTWTAEGEL